MALPNLLALPAYRTTGFGLAVTNKGGSKGDQSQRRMAALIKKARKRESEKERKREREKERKREREKERKREQRESGKERTERKREQRAKERKRPIQGASGSNREAESTDVPERGALPRSSNEAG
jgi:hypothetical protein